jgi:hypothetical protein
MVNFMYVTTSIVYISIKYSHYISFIYMMVAEYMHSSPNSLGI